MRKFFSGLLLIFSFYTVHLWAEEPQNMRLYSRETVTPLNFTLSDADWRWLGEKREINIGTYAPENPPYTLVPESGVFEGVSADYALLIMRYLGLRFKVLHYQDRNAALEGVRSGSIDMLLDDAGGVFTPQKDLVSSIPYMPDHPALVSRETTMSRPLTLKNEPRISVVKGYFSDSWITSHFPGARIQYFLTPQSALSSVAFGENDYFIGNLTTASFLIERNYATTLSISDIFSEEETGPRFTFSAKETPLQRAVDAILSAITPNQHKIIFRHWSQGPNIWLFKSQLTLTEREKKWLSDHNELRVVINPLYAPFTLFDQEKQLHGIAADVLKLIHLRTGLNFKAIEADSVVDMFNLVREHKGDFIASMSYSSSRDRQLLFTRPYVQPPFVLVIRDSATASADLSGNMKIAITPDNALRGWLKKNYPSITLVDASNASIAMQMVNEGDTDGAVNNLIGARYLIDRYFRGKLKIAKRIGEDTARISFAVGRDKPELYSILNKALADIPPRDISMIANKWQGTPDIQLNTWTSYRSEFYWLVGIFIILIVTSIIWNYYLHREIRLKKEAQKKLQEHVSFQNTLFNGTPTPVYVIDINGNMINHNTAWENYFKKENSDFHSLPLYSSEHPLAEIFKDVTLALNNQHAFALPPHSYVIQNDFEKRVIIHQAATFNDHMGRVAGIIGSWQDITEREALLFELSLAREHAEQANRAKSTFLATMSHEIRTPISAIIGLLELSVTSQQDSGDKTEKNTIQVAYDSAVSLMGLIGDILDLAKIESGRLELSPEWVKTNVLALPIVQVFDGLARQKGLTLNYQLDQVHPDEVYIDPLRFRQILSNLVSNAIKFTSTGAINIHVQYLNQDATHVRLFLSVSDSGVGISPEEQIDIFSPYVQSESGKNHSGTGLGLAICHQLTTMMNGTIELYSQVNRGTKVTVKIPVEHRRSQHILEHNEASFNEDPRPLKIMAVDDHPANRLLLSRQLLRLGHAVVEAENGQQALDLWDNDIDLVITDCSMPEIDGLELTRRLRAIHTGPLIILGLTANAQPEERRRCIDAGMNDCIFKPLRLNQLDNLLKKLSVKTNKSASEAVSRNTPLDDIINMADLKKLTNHDNGLLTQILNTTRIENAKDIKKCRDALLTQDWPSLTTSLHRIAGAAKIIGVISLEKECRALEKYSESTQFIDYEYISMQLDKIENDLMHLDNAISDFIS